MKKILLLLMLLWMVVGLWSIGSAIYWTQPTISDQEVELIARHDLAVIDLENLFNNPDNLRAIKKVNSKIIILVYVNFFEVWQEPIPVNRPFGQRMSRTINHHFPEWLLVRQDQQPVTFWAGMQPLNLSDLCPEIQGLNYIQYLQDVLLENVLQDKIWDGLFLDNLFHRISWLGDLDLDRDGAAEDSRTIDYHWYRGVDNFLTGLRQAKGSKFKIWGNHLSLNYGQLIDGRFLEGFPTEDYSWEEAMSIAEQLPAVIFQGKGSNIELAFNSSLLLDNAYFCLGQNMAVPWEKIEKLKKLNKIPPKQRGEMEFKAGYYRRNLGEETIEVFINRQISQ